MQWEYSFIGNTLSQLYILCAAPSPMLILPRASPTLSSGSAQGHQSRWWRVQVWPCLLGSLLTICPEYLAGVQAPTPAGRCWFIGPSNTPVLLPWASLRHPPLPERFPSGSLLKGFSGCADAGFLVGRCPPVAKCETLATLPQNCQPKPPQ